MTDDGGEEKGKEEWAVMSAVVQRITPAIQVSSLCAQTHNVGQQESASGCEHRRPERDLAKLLVRMGYWRIWIASATSLAS